MPTHTELDLLLRALASHTRLRILGLLFSQPVPGIREVMPRRYPCGPDSRIPTVSPPGWQPKFLAARLHISRPAVSQHLKTLLRLRLIRYWKHDRRKFYTLARLRTGSLRSRMLDGVQAALSPRQWETLPPVFAAPHHRRPTGAARRARPPNHGKSQAPALETLWADLTCHSHFRRLLMLRHLLSHGRASVTDLAFAADLSKPTTRYHLKKWIRRKVVSESIDEFRLVTPGTNPLRRLVPHLLTDPAGQSRREHS